MTLRPRVSLVPYYFLAAALAVRLGPVALNALVLTALPAAKTPFARPSRGAFSVEALVVLMVSLGAGRAWRMPSIRSGYFTWLRETPWAGKLKLPFGNAAPTLLDCTIFLACGCILAAGIFRLDLALLIGAGAYAAGYTAMMAARLLEAGRFSQVYLLALGCVGIVAALHWPLLSIGVGAATFVGASIIARLHVRWLAAESLLPRRPAPAMTNSTVGWPYLALSSEMPVGIGLQWAFLWAVFFGFIEYTILSYAGRGSAPSLLGTVSTVAIFAALVLAATRTYFYVFNRRPPMSLRGRLATKKWIIPEYDRVFAAPVATLLAGCAVAAMRTFFLTRAAVAWYGGLGLFLIGFVGMGLGPSLKDWILTGHYRLVRTLSETNEINGPPGLKTGGNRLWPTAGPPRQR